MTFEEKLKKCSAAEIWQEYCGFLDLSLSEYMEIQKRLLMEQVELMAGCQLGQRFFRNGVPHSVEEFRETVPLTKFLHLQFCLPLYQHQGRIYPGCAACHLGHYLDSEPEQCVCHGPKDGLRRRGMAV